MTTLLETLAGHARSLFAPETGQEDPAQGPDFSRGRHDEAASACYETSEEAPRYDWRPDTVEVCKRPLDNFVGEYFADILPIPHEYLRTPSGKEAGMGMAPGGFDAPFTPITMTDHSHEPDRPVWGCEPVPADPACVDNELERLMGQDLGRWTPFNNCWSIVDSIVEKCRLPEPPDPYADNRTDEQIEAELSSRDSGYGP